MNREILKKMLIREEELRHSEDVLARMYKVQQNGGDWIGVAEQVQEQVIREFLPGEKDMEQSLYHLRTAHIKYPELGILSVYVRNNIARSGTLQVGDDAVQCNLYDPDGNLIGLDRWIKKTSDRPLVVFAGSFT